MRSSSVDATARGIGQLLITFRQHTPVSQPGTYGVSFQTQARQRVLWRLWKAELDIFTTVSPNSGPHDL